MAKLRTYLLNLYENIKNNYISLKKGGAATEEFEEPALRIIIKLCSTHELPELDEYQGKDASEKTGFWNVHRVLRGFLVETNLLSGFFAGSTSVLGKIFLISCAHSPGAFGWVHTASVWVSGLAIIATIYSNLYNLNLTVSLYSQLIVMPTYECCIIFGTLLSGGLVMGEFSYYTKGQLFVIMIGCCFCVSGILYKLSKVEHSDIVDEEEEAKKKEELEL